MYKLIIVEDEEIVRSGLKNGTDWTSLGFEVIGTASNGIEALELIENQVPDVILTDIRMPDMDGIELMKILRQRHSEVEIVILSGYDDFQYARSAVKYDAYEYLTKPVDDIEFHKVFKEIYQRIREKRQALYTSTNEKTGSKTLDVDKLRDIFLSTLFSKPLDEEFINKSIHELNIDLNENCYCVAALQADFTEKGHDYKLEGLLKEENTGLLIENGYPFVIIEGSCIILLSKKIKSSYYDLSRDMIKFKEILQKNASLESERSISVSIGISKLHNSLKDIRSAYYEALEALKFRFYIGNDRIISYNDIHSNKPAADEYKKLNLSINELFETVIPSENTEWSRNARKLFMFIKELALTDVTYVRIKCLEIMVILDNKLKDKGIVSEELGKRELLYKEIFNKNTLDELQNWFVSKIDNLSAASKSSSVDQTKSLLQQVRSYILNNIRDKIYLNDIAATVHMSPNYLSAAFTKETGLNLSKYIMDVKIEKAKEYLTESDMRIQEISDELGFSDYRYFCTVFKKETGVTPLDYRTKNYK